MEKRENCCVNEFFAASNSFSGFINHFSEVFDPLNFDRLFLLKGGPGTGKSSFMKGIVKNFINNCYCELIYCSSDNKSLDGVILESDKGRVAVFDSTAPHMKDTEYPGAIDEIINLGEGWDGKELSKRREEIIELNTKKSKSYQDAYTLLRLCGVVKKEKQRLIKDMYNGNDNDLIKDIISKINNKKQSRILGTRLLSSFSREGFFTLKPIEAENKISVLGSFGSPYVFLDRLISEAENGGIECVKFPSPFSFDYIDAVLIGDTFFSVNHRFESAISTDRFIYYDGEYEKAMLECYEQYEKELLSEAQKAFIEAFDFHLRLEEIYTLNMNFDINKRISEDLVLIIREILF